MRVLFRSSLLFFLVLIHLPIHASSDLGAKIQAIQQKYSVVGLSAVAVKNGAVIWNTNFGLADMERQVPVTDRTKFRIASISKIVTTTALMQLWEKGKFKLDDDISRYLGWRMVNPNYPGTPITFRHLLTHTSSLTDNANYDKFLKLTYDAPDHAPDIKEIFHSDGAYYNGGTNFTTNAPGTKYRYCNLAFGLVGTLVEKISGEPFQSYCSKNILKPLGMTASFNVALLPDINDVAVLYDYQKNEFLPQTDNYRGIKPEDRIGSNYRPGNNALVFGPQGGLRTSALDLAKFMMQFMDRQPKGAKRVLKKSTIELMLREQWTNGKEGNDNVSRGLGFQCTLSLIPNELWTGHTGSAYGLKSSMFFLSKDSIGVVLITNGSKPGENETGFPPMRKEMTQAIVDFLRNSPAKK
jgi:CubicO group peptidase (beta-lactamase class C family)